MNPGGLPGWALSRRPSRSSHSTITTNRIRPADHLDLEPDDVPPEPVESGDSPMARLMIPGAILLVIVLIVIAFLIFS
jgi:hypothetical protein